MIDSMSEDELFKPYQIKWADDATKTAIWEVYKFIHINTVAPFGTFRIKIRNRITSEKYEIIIGVPSGKYGMTLLRIIVM